MLPQNLFVFIFFIGSLGAANLDIEVTLGTDASPLEGGTYDPGGAGVNLRGAMNRLNLEASGTHTITFSGSVSTVTLTAPLPPINLNSAALGTVTIGNSSTAITLNGASAPVRGGFCVANSNASNPVTIQNMTITGATATGGDGGDGQAAGGAGMGGGGGLFIDWPASGVPNVILSNVTFTSCAATGGAGGTLITNSADAISGGGGGGLGGNGGQGGDPTHNQSDSSGAGGGGLFGRGGNANADVAPGPVEGGGGGGGGLYHGGNGNRREGGGGGGGGCWGALGGNGSNGGAASVSGNVNNGTGVILNSDATMFLGGGGGGGGANPVATNFSGAGGAAEQSVTDGAIGAIGNGGGNGSQPGAGGGGVTTAGAADGTGGDATGNGGNGGDGGLFGGGGGSGQNGPVAGKGAGIPGDGGLGGGGGGAASSGQGALRTGGAGGYGGGGGGGTGSGSAPFIGPGGPGGKFGGGGGGGVLSNGPTVADGGDGGFGAAGGGGGTGGTGGYGAGGGGGQTTGGSITYGGGDTTSRNGGGGAGFGGALFINAFESTSTNTVTLASYFTTASASNSTTAGAAGGTGATAGVARGNDLFIATPSAFQITLHLNPPSSQTMTIANSMNDDSETINSVSNAGITLLIGSASSGTVVLGGTNSYIKGATTINSGGTLQVNTINALSGSTVGNVANSGTFVVNPVNANELYPTTGVISGTGAVTVGLSSGGGTGIVRFEGAAANTYSGITTIESGTLRLSNASSFIGVPGDVTINGGTLDRSTSPNQIVTSSNMTLSGGTFIMGGGFAQTLSTLDFQAGTLTQGVALLTLSSNDTPLTMRDVQISGAVTLSGTTPIVAFDATNNGTATLSSLNMGGETTTFNIANGTAATDMNISSTLTNGNLTKTGAGTLSLSGTDANTSITTTTVSAGTLDLNKTGVIAIPGNISIDGGTLRLLGNNQIATTSNITLSTSASATFNLNNFSNTIANLSGGSGANGNVSLGSGTLTMSPTATTTYSGAISGTGGLTKTGAFIQVLDGTSNTYSGTTTISAGTLQSGAADSFSPNSLFTISGSSAILNLNSFSQEIKRLDFEQGTLSYGALETLTLNNNGIALVMRRGTTVSGDVTLSGGSSQMIVFDATPPGNANTTAILTNAGKSLELSNQATTFSISSGPSSPDMEINGNITNGAAITKTGAGILRFSGTNSYGDLTINEGTLQAGATSAVPSTSALTFANTSGATFDLGGNDISIALLSGGGSTGGTVSLGANTVTLTETTGTTTFSGAITGTGGLTKTGASAQVLNGSGLNTYSGSTTINAGTLRAGAAGAFSSSSPIVFADVATATLDLNNNNNSVQSLSGGGSTGGNVSLGSGTLTLAATTGTTAYSGAISGTGGLTKTGSSTQTLNSSGLNTYSGATTINAGTLKAGAANAFSPNSGVVLADVASATLDLDGKENTIAFLSGGGSTGGNVLSGGADLTVGTTAGGTATHFGTILGGGNFFKTGTSKQSLNALNAYTGPQVTINGGTLFVNGSIQSLVTVNNSGTFGGIGTITGNVTVENGGTIVPGDSIGKMTIVGNLTLKSESNTEIEILPTTADLLKVEGTGLATTDGTLHLITFPEIYPLESTYTFLTAEGGLISTSPGGLSENGGFATVNVDFAELFNVIVKAHPLASLPFIELTIHFIPPQIPTERLSGNRRILADYFNSDPDFFFNTIFPIDQLPIEEIRYILDTISPARLAASTSAAINVGLASIQTIVEREQQSRFLHFRKSKDLNNVVALKNDTLNGLLAQNSIDLPRGETRIAAREDSSIAGYGNWTTQINHEKRQDQNPAFNTFSSQGNAGFEKFFAHGLVGIVGNYANTWISQDTVSEVHVYGGSLYGVGYIEDAFIDVSLSGYGLSFKSNRRIPFPGSIISTPVDDKAASHHNGYELIPHLGAGYDVGFNWGSLEPYIAFDWAYINEDDFTETGPSVYNMHVFKRHGSVLRSQIGLNAYQAFDKDWGVIFLKEELSYVNLEPFSIGDVRATIPGSVDNFTVFALRNNQSRARASFELFFRTNKGSFVSTQYGLEVGSQAFAQRVSATLGRYF